MNIKNAKHVHFTGIKGVGMTSLSLCCQDLGIKITGSDVEEEFVTDETLKNRGLPWKIGFKKENLNPKPDLLVFTGAHGGLNNHLRNDRNNFRICRFKPLLCNRGRKYSLNRNTWKI